MINSVMYLIHNSKLSSGYKLNNTKDTCVRPTQTMKLSNAIKYKHIPNEKL